MQEDLALKARHIITHLLSIREHSHKELLEKLSFKGIPQEVSLNELQKFVDNNIQSDVRFKHSLIKSLAAKGKGPNYIRQKLQQHDVSTSDLISIANEHFIDWFTLAQTARVKRFGADIPDDWQTRQKQKRFLHNRGFSAEQIDEAFRLND